MKKTIFILIFSIAILIFSSCGNDEKKTSTDNESENDSDVEDVTKDDETADPDIVGDFETIPDDDSHGDPIFDTGWLAPDPSWESWAYLRMDGILSSDGTLATFAEGKIKLSQAGKTIDFESGSYIDQYLWNAIDANASAYEVYNVNEDENTASVDYHEMILTFPKELIQDMKEDGTETDFGAMLLFKSSVFDVTYNDSNEIVDTKLREICYEGISMMEQMEVESESFELPVGGIWGCRCCSDCEEITLKMMFRNQVNENPDDILLYLNTQDDGTVLNPEDDGYTKQCTCIDENENEISCDGEEIPDEESDENSDNELNDN